MSWKFDKIMQNLVVVKNDIYGAKCDVLRRLSIKLRRLPRFVNINFERKRGDLSISALGGKMEGLTGEQVIDCRLS